MPLLQFDALIALAGSEGPSDYFASLMLEHSGLLIAADDGARALLDRGYAPDILAGDLDSLPDEDLRALPAKTRIVRFSPDKDYTDGELSAALAVTRLLEIPAPKEDPQALYDAFMEVSDLSGLSFVFLNPWGIRPDHSLANLDLARLLALRGGEIYLTDGTSLARIIAGPFSSPALFSSELFRQAKKLDQNRDFQFSVLAMDDQVRGLTVRGLKWELNNKKMPRGRSLGIGNRARGSYPDEVFLSLEEGTVISFVYPAGL